MALHALGDADRARDVAQETMTRVLDALERGRVRDPSKLAAFARGVAHNVIADVHRVRSREAALGDDLPDSRAAHPLDTIVSHEDNSAIQSALEHLSADDRELLRLVFVDGLTPGEIAERLREPAERVRKRKSRAIERLREHYFRIVERARSGHVSVLRPTMDERSARPLVTQRGES